MKMATVKYELSSGKQHLCVLEAAGDIMESNNCVKRRRRNSSVVTHLASKEQPKQLDHSQSATATATTVKRSSRFRGVSRHRWTGRYEAHLWDKGSWNPTQRKKGKQVYLGAYDEEESAARAYDLAALKYWGTSTLTNFPVSDYEEEVEIMKTVTREQYLASLRRRSSGFSRGVSKYRGVARHHHNGRWEARIGRVFGNKYLYLGTYGTQEEAAHAYDIAAIEYRGINAVTNFDLSTYIRWLRPGAKCFSSDQEPNTSTSTQSITPSTSNTTPISKYITEMSLFNPNSFTEVGDLDIKKQEDIFLNLQGQNTSTACTKSSSPTALGLLLKSSIFKELVEKNLNAESKDKEENERNSSLLQMKNDMSFETNCNVPFMVSLNAEKLPSLVSQEDSALPLFSGRGQFLRSLDMESSTNPFN